MPFAIQKSINERNQLTILADDVKKAYKYYKYILKNPDTFPTDYPEKCKNDVIICFNAYRKQRKILDHYIDEKTLKEELEIIKSLDNLELSRL